MSRFSRVVGNADSVKGYSQQSDLGGDQKQLVAVGVEAIVSALPGDHGVFLDFPSLPLSPGPLPIRAFVSGFYSTLTT